MSMKAFIKSAVSISPQDTFRAESFQKESFRAESFLPEARLPERDFFLCQHPPYKEFINPAALRRMSPVIRMGLCSAIRSLEEAGADQTGAILVGSGLGCVRDTVKFLGQMIDNGEQLLNPTAFIQSTHNTVSGQIALHLGCREYNLTFSQKSLSFESALMDALMVLEQDKAENVLVGGLDELTEESYSLMRRAVCVRPWTEGDSRAGAAMTPGNGFVAGEGASFFTLGRKAGESTMARIEALRMINRPGSTAGMSRETGSFLEDHGLRPGDVDVLVTGRNGDVREEALYRAIEDGFPGSIHLSYKHLTGEYDTASAFGMFLGSKILQRQEIPSICRLNQVEKPRLNTLLQINQKSGKDLSLILLSALSP